MKNKKITSPDNIALDAYEQEIEDSLDIANKQNLSEENKSSWAETAKNHVLLQKSKRITLSVSVEELLKFKAKANKKGIPYQTLMNVIMKQYNDGEIQIGL